MEPEVNLLVSTIINRVFQLRGLTSSTFQPCGLANCMFQLHGFGGGSRCLKPNFHPIAGTRSSRVFQLCSFATSLYQLCGPWGGGQRHET